MVKRIAKNSRANFLTGKSMALVWGIGKMGKLGF